MRGTVKLSIAGLLVCSSCSVPSQQEEEPPQPNTGGVFATITVEGDPGNCNFQWNGDPISTDDIIDRGTDIIDAAVEAHSGAENMIETDIPYARVKAAGDMPYHCISLAIGALRRVGFSRGELEIRGEESPLDVNFHLPIEDWPSDQRIPPSVIALDDEGEIFVRGEWTSLEDLPIRVMQMRDSKPVAASFVPIDIPIYTPDYVLLPSARTQFARIVETARSLKQADISFELLECILADFEASFTVDQVGTPPTCYA